MERLMASTLRMLLAAALLTSGCVTLAPQPGGSDSEGPRARTTLRQTAASAPAFGAPSALASTEPGDQEQSHRRRTAREVASTGSAAEGPATCGGVAVPLGWPDFSSGDGEALLAPFLTCTSPAEFLALQERVDMPRVVEALDDWRAVRLGAQGTPREDVARLLNRKRTSFLVDAPEAYGAINAGVLSLFIIDSAHDDDLREILFLLARDKRLEETLAQLPAFQMALEKRGLKPTARPDRDFETRDLGRGLARAGRDALSSSPVSGGGADFAFLPIRGQLPPEYQKALAQAEERWAQRHFSPGNVALGGFDHLTFGVPLGFYGLLAGTGQGLQSLAQGRYEQATRELAPAALLVALYAGGKGMRSLTEERGAPGMGPRILIGLEALEVRMRALEQTARQWEGRLGPEGLRQLARYLQASREAGRFVAVGGADAALALYEARGDVARARPLLSRARPGATGASPVKGAARTGAREAAAVADEATRPLSNEARGAERLGTLASLVDEGAGHTREVVEARLAAVELESTGPRLPKYMSVLEKHRPSLDAPPPEARGNPRWSEYVAYYDKRLGEVKEGTAAEGPLRYADVLVIEEGEVAGQPRRVETFSFKSRDLSGLKGRALGAQMIVDAREALAKYGETLDIRRHSLQRLIPGGSEVRVVRVRLVYEGGPLMPERRAGDLKNAVDEVREEVPGVEVLFQ